MNRTTWPAHRPVTRSTAQHETAATTSSLSEELGLPEAVEPSTEQTMTSTDLHVRPSQTSDRPLRPLAVEAAARVPTYIANDIPSAPEIPAPIDELRSDSRAGRAQTVITTCSWNPVASTAAMASLNGVPSRNPSDVLSSELGRPVPVSDGFQHGSSLSAGNSQRVASRQRDLFAEPLGAALPVRLSYSASDRQQGTDRPSSWDVSRTAPAATRAASNSVFTGQHGMAGWGDGGRHGTRPGDFKSEPKVSLPIYKGKAEWRTFWLQFERLAQRFGWGSEETLDRLVSCLREEALDHFAALPTEVQRDLYLTTLSFTRRFDDHRLPETYRASLQTLKKQSKESLEEFAARVRKLVTKAYPGIAGSAILEDMTIEHLVGGLTDQTLMYDVLTKKPRTVEEALDLIQWQESCKGIQKRRLGVRQLAVDYTSDDDELPVRRINGKAYVTEERLNQFGRELRDGLVKDLRQELKRGPSGPRQGRRNANWKESVECFRCHELGHILRECPERETGKEANDKTNLDDKEVPLN